MLTVLTTKIAGIGAGSGVMFEMESIADTANLLHSGGWTILTGINLMLFSLLHNPCSTTIYTIYKETKSAKWTLISTFLPIAMGIIICFFVTQIWRLIS
jgi:ferrous iron transport protein B